MNKGCLADFVLKTLQRLNKAGMKYITKQLDYIYPY